MLPPSHTIIRTVKQRKENKWREKKAEILVSSAQKLLQKLYKIQKETTGERFTHCYLTQKIKSNSSMNKQGKDIKDKNKERNAITISSRYRMLSWQITKHIFNQKKPPGIYSAALNICQTDQGN